MDFALSRQPSRASAFSMSEVSFRKPRACAGSESHVINLLTVFESVSGAEASSVNISLVRKRFLLSTRSSLDSKRSVSKTLGSWVTCGPSSITKSNARSRWLFSRLASVSLDKRK